MTASKQIATDLLIMNRDALAALVTLGGNDPLKFITNPTDRFIVSKMLEQVR